MKESIPKEQVLRIVDYKLKQEELLLKNNLAQIRKDKKLSQADLAKMVGVSRNTIRVLE